MPIRNGHDIDMTFKMARTGHDMAYIYTYTYIHGRVIYRILNK